MQTNYTFLEMSNVLFELKTHGYAELDALLDKLSREDNWRAIEDLSKYIYDSGFHFLSNAIFKVAEDKFYSQQTMFDYEFVNRLSINWERYLEFYPDIKVTQFSKLEVIRHLCVDGVGKGRLSRYLLHVGKSDLGSEVLRDYSERFSEDNRFLEELKILADASKYPIKNDNILLPKCLKELDSLKSDLDAVKSLVLSIEAERESENANIYSALRFVRENLETVESFDPLAKQKIRLEVPDHTGLYGEMSDERDSVIGRNGWIFINDGSNKLMQYQTGKEEMPTSEIDEWQTLLSKSNSWCKNKGIDYVHLIVPNKVSVYPEFFPTPVNSSLNRPAVQISEKNSDFVIYPLDKLIRNKKTYRLYEKQNSHWSFWGCYITYRTICKHLGIGENDELIKRVERKVVLAKGDLGIKHGTYEWLVQEKIPLNSEIVYDNEVIKYAHQGSIRILKNNSRRALKKKMIIFGDSFSNPAILDSCNNVIRHCHRLSTLFAETLSEVHFVWTPWVDFQYVEAEKPDFVVTQLAERFLIKIPEDRFNGATVHDFAETIIKGHKDKKTVQ